MSADIRYLSQRSLAVHEATVIDQFAKMHRRNVKIQGFTFAVWVSVFIFLAAMTIFLPVATQSFIKVVLNP